MKPTSRSLCLAAGCFRRLNDAFWGVRRQILISLASSSWFFDKNKPTTLFLFNSRFHACLRWLAFVYHPIGVIATLSANPRRVSSQRSKTKTKSQCRAILTGNKIAGGSMRLRINSEPRAQVLAHWFLFSWLFLVSHQMALCLRAVEKINSESWFDLEARSMRVNKKKLGKAVLPGERKRKWVNFWR